MAEINIIYNQYYFSFGWKIIIGTISIQNSKLEFRFKGDIRQSVEDKLASVIDKKY